VSIREKGKGRGEKKLLPLLDFCDHFQEDLVAATRPLWVFQKLVGWFTNKEAYVLA
jgi:hypothetical protein